MKEVVLASAILLLSGCSQISVRHHSAGRPLPFCEKNSSVDRGVVYWGTLWRPDQKEKELRESMARSALEKYFAKSPCFRSVEIVRLLENADPLLATDAEIIADAKQRNAATAFVIALEELGPNVMLYCSPILWATRNDVVFQTRVIDVKTGRLQARHGTHWQKGGAFTWNGADTLTDDMVKALSIVFGEPQ